VVPRGGRARGTDVLVLGVPLLLRSHWLLFCHAVLLGHQEERWRNKMVLAFIPGEMDTAARSPLGCFSVSVFP
jgi:hypothetical protein